MPYGQLLVDPLLPFATWWDLVREQGQHASAPCSQPQLSERTLGVGDLGIQILIVVPVSTGLSVVAVVLLA